MQHQINQFLSEQRGTGSRFAPERSRPTARQVTSLSKKEKRKMNSAWKFNRVKIPGNVVSYKPKSNTGIDENILLQAAIKLYLPSQIDLDYLDNGRIKWI